ncbi:protein of unknown function UPF0099 (plasmid) [Pseudarthrobacter chlorophenolicus A6]|uniref:peptidyl-tRNA hydrolase n=1 Tax=Pseudarthrobacter chlorophenolicus (strain ATCC 700700 / DSM 12829 / CIP 107037 / JCM 12360 / KCTC 9906 / NCIMB 13794 / A6) TaxID=452863 RepID=B8HIU3_PSECP|nr:peptidyl-tRNA hydrolase [Pseudarthrobacter chlorophenolicus]ACL42340.1 protein of unknown function UPF0099 [Pseudarthrobacter chlorophenolicus A6]SDQ16723.1 Peptidyl-tRNA hydrolase [Pseudarthrobacter chlorophenolicus]
MTDSPSLVQPIVLLVDKNDPAGHSDSILAVAIASVCAYTNGLEHGADDGSWKTWLSGRFTKSVRRADAKTFAKIAGDPELPADGAAWIGAARAMAYAPTTYEDMPKKLSRLQVSGTDLPAYDPTPQSRQRPGDPVIVLNNALGMSTGKAAAQAAHALFAWHLNRGNPDPDIASLHLLSAGLINASESEFEQLKALAAGPVIVDSGLTEIEPNTATAFVIERP